MSENALHNCMIGFPRPPSELRSAAGRQEGPEMPPHPIAAQPILGLVVDGLHEARRANRNNCHLYAARGDHALISLAYFMFHVKQS